MSPTDHEVQDYVRAEIARQDVAAASAQTTAVVPAKSTLAPAAAETKAQLEASMADPKGDYWRFARNQQLYADLVRAEQLGQADAAGPVWDGDTDVPRSIAEYDLGNHISAEDRDIVDLFLPVALDAGLGRAKVRSAVQWVATGAAATVDEFRSLAITRGWSDSAIDLCVTWYRNEAAKRGVTV